MSLAMQARADHEMAQAQRLLLHQQCTQLQAQVGTQRTAPAAATETTADQRRDALRKVCSTVPRTDNVWQTTPKQCPGV